MKAKILSFPVMQKLRT